MNPLVIEYLARLDAALAAVSPARRDEIVDDIRAHIEAELVGRDDVSDAEVRTLLDRIGSPSDIAAAAGADDAPPPPVPAAPVSRPRLGGYEIATIVLLLAGGFVFFVGWVVGVVLLWTSAAWRVRDKVIATVLVPGGLATAMFLLAFATVSTTTSSGTCPAGPNASMAASAVTLPDGAVAPVTPVAPVTQPQPAELVPQNAVPAAGCRSDTDYSGYFGLALLVVCFVGPVFSAVWLGVHANRRRPAPGEFRNEYADAVS